VCTSFARPGGSPGATGAAAWWSDLGGIGTVTDSSIDPPAGSGIDTTVPHSARIWNYWLGGKDNYAVDREAGDAWVAVDPQITVIARAQRAFLSRTVRYLAGEVGIRQFLDIGTGLPTADNTHEVAQRVAPDARIVYVDNDPLVLAHARALLTSTPEGATRYLHADLHDSEALVEGAAAVLDLARPVAVLFMGVLGHVRETAEAKRAVDAIVDRVPPGSYLVICDGTHASGSAGAQQAQDEYADTGAVPYRYRTPEEIASLFDGLELVEPGCVSITQWRPELPEGVPAISADPPAPVDEFGGVARKP
jgi:O-methyltransferase involved in polyketide biosynthesis